MSEPTIQTQLPETENPAKRSRSSPGLNLTATRFLTTNDIASLAKIGRKAAIALIDSGVIPSRLIGKRRRVKEQDWETYAARPIRRKPYPYFSEKSERK